MKLLNDNPSVGEMHDFDCEFPVLKRIVLWVGRRDSVR
jgi:hypothetical protein